MNFKYSIVATAFNDSASIIRYLNDMCSQSLPPSEIIIADGGSTDDTIKLANEHASKSNIKIRVLSGKRLNIPEGYNEAIKNATEKYIGISGIGNRYDKDYFFELAKAIDNTEFDLAYSPIRGYDSNRFSKLYNTKVLGGVNGQCLSFASNHGALVKKSVFEDLGYFYENFIYAGEDTEFYLLVRDRGYKTILVKSAKVYWETPENMKQFIKQIKNYTIADLQIYSKKQWNNIKHRVVKVTAFSILLIFIVIVLCCSAKLMYKSILFMLLASLIVFRKYRNNGGQNWMLRVKNYLPIYYTLKYRAYMGKEYTVNRNGK